MAIDVNQDQITSATTRQIETFVNDYMHTSKALMSAFPGVPDETTRLMQKIRKIIFKYYEATPLSYVPVLSYDYGITDEEAKIDYLPAYTASELLQLIKNDKSIQPTWRDPAYSLPEQEPFAIGMEFKDKEMMEIVRNPAEHANVIAQKMRAFNNTLVKCMNGLQKNALKHLIKLILNIYKKAPKFNSATEYKRANYDTNANRTISRATYGIDLVYLKNADGTKVGVLFKNIPANTFNSYEEAEADGSIVTLNILKKIRKPSKGNSKVEEQESVDNFIKEMKQLELDLNEDLQGYCLNGSEIGNRQKEIRTFLINTIYPLLAVDAYAGANNIGQLRMPLVDNAITMHRFFDKDEIEADNNAEADAQLGLSHVYGLIGDFSSEQPLASIQVEEKGTSTQTVDHREAHHSYIQAEVLTRFVISPNQFVTLIVDEGFTF